MSKPLFEVNICTECLNNSSGSICRQMDGGIYRDYVLPPYYDGCKCTATQISNHEYELVMVATLLLDIDDAVQRDDPFIYDSIETCAAMREAYAKRGKNLIKKWQDRSLDTNSGQEALDNLRTFFYEHEKRIQDKLKISARQ